MKRKAVYLDVNSDLASALSKFSHSEGDEIVLVVPKGSLIFNSVINLKILKSNAAQQNKPLALVTMDTIGRAMAKQVGLKVYKSLTSEEEFNPQDETTIPVEEASAPSQPSKLTPEPPKQPPAFTPMQKIERRRRAPQSSLYKEIASNDAVAPTPPPATAKINKSRAGMMFIFVFLAILVLGGVVYFVLPRATVSLEVKAESFVHQFRLVLADEEDLNIAGQNVFKGRFVEVTKELVQTFQASGSENKGNAASGFITIYNYTQTMKGLIPETRFVSPDELVFRIKEEVLISPATTNSAGTLVPGRTKVKVVADTGGTDGNLPADTKFTVPGLGSVGIDLVYGKNDEPFTGGTDNKVNIVSQEDIEAARESISKNVFLDTELELQDLVKKDEELIMPLIQNDVIDSVPSVPAGSKREAFDLKIQVRSWTLLPKKESLEEIIHNSVDAIIPLNYTLTDQTLKVARVEVDNTDFLMHTIDFGVEIDGLIAPDLNESEIAGSIANRTPQSATQLLNSISEIISHKIVLWPFWVNRLPILENNIKITSSYIS